MACCENDCREGGQIWMWMMHGSGHVFLMYEKSECG